MKSDIYLIFGANSDLAIELMCHCHDKKFILCSRTKINSKKIKLIGLEKIINSYEFDFIKYDLVIKNLDKIFKYYKPEKIFFFQGFLPSPDYKKIQDIVNTYEVNVISIAIILNYIQVNFIKFINEIIVISSIAGDRGKSKNPIYDSSKASLNYLVEGYRGRFEKQKINILLVKPGNLSTKMSKKYIKKNIFLASTSRVSKLILKNLNKNKKELYAPSYWFIIMTLIKLIPAGLFRFLKLDNAN